MLQLSKRSWSQSNSRVDTFSSSYFATSGTRLPQATPQKFIWSRFNSIDTWLAAIDCYISMLLWKGLPSCSGFSAFLTTNTQPLVQCYPMLFRLHSGCLLITRISWNNIEDRKTNSSNCNQLIASCITFVPLLAVLPWYSFRFYVYFFAKFRNGLKLQEIFQLSN